MVAYGLEVGSDVDEGRVGGVGGAGEDEAILAFALERHKQLHTGSCAEQNKLP